VENYDYDLKKSYLCKRMKKFYYILRTATFTCLFAGMATVCTLQVRANAVEEVAFDNKTSKEKEKTKKVALVPSSPSNYINKLKSTVIPETKLSLDGKVSSKGIMSTTFNLSNTNRGTMHVQSVVTYKVGNATYIVPSNVNVPILPADNSLRYHQVNVKLPFRKG
jgi:hypothetical protein